MIRILKKNQGGDIANIELEGPVIKPVGFETCIRAKY